MVKLVILVALLSSLSFGQESGAPPAQGEPPPGNPAAGDTAGKGSKEDSKKAGKQTPVRKRYELKSDCDRECFDFYALLRKQFKSGERPINWSCVGSEDNWHCKIHWPSNDENQGNQKESNPTAY